ncbi:DNA-binding response regulator [Cohnella terricola]|uniref:DNA-binding response regulator n=1 Tax=Cohnella terricola TaxID=1289167 RepID=A0A559JIL5_9BACL|nr:DNA-binding response regulator [Cohnella terricola]TVX99712.1 DNA-binding response regulator [Cohnella terricola]
MGKQFESEYRAWLERHIGESRGERLRRIKDRHGFGEKSFLEHVWWPVVGNLDDLHPEYEFIDARGKYSYMDYGYIRDPGPTCIECDGFGTHARDTDRYTFMRGLDRQNEIVLGGWNILRFSVDKLKEDPVDCQSFIRRMMEEWYGQERPGLLEIPLYQREIVRLAARSVIPITVEMACDCLGKKEKFVRREIRELVEKRILAGVSGIKRICAYRLTKYGRQL